MSISFFEIAGCFALAYLCGSIPFGYLIGKFNGIDIRHYGSHNIGATNVRRVLGGGWSNLCFLLDFLKGLLPVLVIARYWNPTWGGIIATMGAIVGHMFPLWLHFKGGKGVSTSLGCVIGMAFWPVFWAAVAWVIVFYRTKIVAIASMTAVVIMALVSLILHWTSGRIPGPVVFLLWGVAAGVIIAHHENISRMLHGKENSFSKKK